ncbi:MAG: NAD(P)H-hydrate dehydratase [Suipraeoptans sp.]
MMKYVPDGNEMKLADNYTINNLNLSSLTLMEEAAKSYILAIKAANIDMSNVIIFCGKGNNAGDGLAIARLLSETGISSTIYMVDGSSGLSKDAAIQFERLSDKKVRVFEDIPKEKYSLIIDAIFGAGLNRTIEGNYYKAIEKANNMSGMKVAIDVPSGISSDNGEVLGVAFKSDLTITIQMPKLGLYINEGPLYSGEICIKEIGISDEVFRNKKSTVIMPDKEDYASLLPKRPLNANKGTFGKVLVIAGSKGMAGAAYLNSYAAYRIGAGLVKVYTHESNRGIIQKLLPEAITTTYNEFDKKQLREAISYADVIVMGSGMGLSEDSFKIVEYVIDRTDKPCIIDGDAITVLSKLKDIKSDIKDKGFVLTPHLKEMERLLGKSVRDIKGYRKELLMSFCKSNQVTCVLKDFRTLISSYNKSPVLSVHGTAAMAKGGSGDVLAGMIGGLIAQKMNSYDACILGTFLHGYAGELAEQKLGSYSVLARDIIDNIGFAIMKILEDENEEV